MQDRLDCPRTRRVMVLLDLVRRCASPVGGAVLAAVFVARGLTAPAYTDSAIVVATTVVRAVHITELRAAVLAVW
jgi:hypothetical protein